MVGRGRLGDQAELLLFVVLSYTTVIKMASKSGPSNVPVSKDALLKSYRKRLKEDVGSMAANFMEIIKLCKVEEEGQITRATQCEEDAFEMQVRAANMVRSFKSVHVMHSGQYQLRFSGTCGRVPDEADQRHKAVPHPQRLSLRQRSHCPQLEDVPQPPGKL